MNAREAARADMVAVPGGEFEMGSNAFYPEERPVHRVAVEAFWIDARPVTVGQFRRFITDTGYVTVAERPLDPDQISGRRSRAPRAGVTRLPAHARPG